MVDYDPKVIQEFAEKLYAKARWMSLRYGVGAMAVVWALIYFARALVNAQIADNVVIVGTLVAAFLGVWLGWTKAFALRFQAQTILLQKRIEENTRPAKS